MKIKDQSHKWSHKLDRIRLWNIRTFPFSSDSAYGSVAYDPVKTILSESEAEADEPTNHNAWNQVLWLVYSSASASDSDNAVFTGASDSNSLIFTRSYRSALLITTPTPTPSPVKTSIYPLFRNSFLLTNHCRVVNLLLLIQLIKPHFSCFTPPAPQFVRN